LSFDPLWQTWLLPRLLGQGRRRLGTHRDSRGPGAAHQAEFLAQERRSLGESWFRQEYCCSFEALEAWFTPISPGASCPSRYVRGRDDARAMGLRRIGGIDFGFRNPFAAVWGVVDRDGVLWLTHEHYGREQPLSYHAAHLPGR